jgi:arsenate reductase (glutaredoxin)
MEFRDLKSKPLSAGEVEALAEKAGGPEKLFSRRAIKYRTMRLAEKKLAPRDLIRLMAEEYTFVSRPVVVKGKKAAAGFSKGNYEELLSS